MTSLELFDKQIEIALRELQRAENLTFSDLALLETFKTSFVLKAQELIED